MLLLLFLGLMMRSRLRHALSMLWPAFFVLAATLSFAGPAQAEHLGLPQLQAFPTAEYPHARKLTRCTRWRLPEGFDQQDLEVSFRGACQAHDQCFHTVGASWSACNHQYRQNLRLACRRDLKVARLQSGQLGEPSGDEVRRCFDLAERFIARVQEKDAIARFNFAQRQQEAYLTTLSQWVAGELAAVDSVDLTVPEVFRMLDQGVSFEDLVPKRASLQAPEKIDEIDDPVEIEPEQALGS